MSDVERAKRSPFPGMDPYLESPALWPDFHQAFLITLREALAERVAPNYFVKIEERIYVTEEPVELTHTARADLAVVAPRRTADVPGNVLVEEPLAAPFVIADLEEEEQREVFLVVQSSGTREVITVIELLSPTNKRAGSVGCEEYLRKRREVLRSRISLVELDLLRTGARVPMSGPLPPADYYVLVHSARHRPKCGVFPFTVRDPLPEIPIPVRDRDSVQLALQPILSVCYARALYGLVIDYRKPPTPPFGRDDAAWAAELCRRSIVGAAGS